MGDILQISGSSSDTTILYNADDFLQLVNDSPTDVNTLVNKYIPCYREENNKGKTNIDQNLQYSSEYATSKKLKMSVSESNCAQHESGNENEMLQMLREKYNGLKHKTDEIYCKKSGSSSCEDLEVQLKEVKKRQDELDKLQRKKHIQQQKVSKHDLVAAHRNIKPTECIKSVTVIIDANLKNEDYMPSLLTQLTEANIAYKFEAHIFPNTISWIRKVPDQSVTNSYEQFRMTLEEENCTEMIYVLQCNEFLHSVKLGSLNDSLVNLSSILPNNKCTFVIYGFKNYKHFKKYKKMLERALTELQILQSVSYRLVDTADDFALLITQFTKAVAEIPFKQQKYQKFKQTQWFIAGDNRDSVKVDKDGNGLNKLWNQILTTFPLARLETAEAITCLYPSLSNLMDGYTKCSSIEEAESLLQDIPIRRAAGPLASTRKIGPELSKKIYNYFTCLNGNVLL